MKRKGFFKALLGGAAVPALTSAEEEEKQDELLDGMRTVMREEIERMMNAPIQVTNTQSKRYTPEGKLEWVGEYEDKGGVSSIAWRRAREGEE